MKNWKHINTKTNFKRFSPKELRGIIDQGKKDIKSGVIVSISTLKIRLV